MGRMGETIEAFLETADGYIFLIPLGLDMRYDRLCMYFGQKYFSIKSRIFRIEKETGLKTEAIN